MRSLWNIATSAVCRLFKTDKVDKKFQQKCEEGRHKEALDIVADKGGDSRKYWGLEVPTFKVIKRLGAGTFGTVFKILLANGQLAALKVSAINRETTASYEAEMVAFERLAGHGGIPVVYWACEANGFYLVALEYFEGGGLSEVTWDAGFEKPLVALDQLLVVLSWAMMNSVVHHDIKPDNVLMSEDGSRFVLADWGFAALAGDCQCHGQHRGWGTQGYTCPEVLHGKAHGYKADMWSLGILLKFLVDGVDLNNEYGHEADLVASLGVNRSRWFKHPIWGTEFGRMVRALICDLCATSQHHRLSVAQARARVAALLDLLHQVKTPDFTLPTLHPRLDHSTCPASPPNVTLCPLVAVTPVAPATPPARVVSPPPPLLPPVPAGEWQLACFRSTEHIASPCPVAQPSTTAASQGTSGSPAQSGEIAFSSAGASSHLQATAHTAIAPSPSPSTMPSQLLSVPLVGIAPPLTSPGSCGGSSFTPSTIPTTASPSLIATAPSPSPTAPVDFITTHGAPNDLVPPAKSTYRHENVKRNHLARGVKTLGAVFGRGKRGG